MIRPTLCARDGDLVANVYRGPRFVSVGGDVLDFAQRQARPSLADAQLAFRALQERIDSETRPRVRRLLAVDALALGGAIAVCIEHRRAAGWADPNAVDGPRVTA